MRRPSLYNLTPIAFFGVHFFCCTSFLFPPFFLFSSGVTQDLELAIVDISKVTSVISEDVIDTMTRLGMLKYSDGEHHIVATPVSTRAALSTALFFCAVFI